MVEFQEFPKIARLYDTYNAVTITEKLDGTNGAVQIKDGEVVAVQSRKKIITPDSDNCGFARWVYDNAETLVGDLGDGTHFGEWVGKKVQRKYDLPEPRFYLFNATRFRYQDFKTERLGTVPLLFHGVVRLLELDETVRRCLAHLETNLSMIDGVTHPEGVVVFFNSDRHGYKVIPPGWGKQGQIKDPGDNFAVWDE